MRLGIWAAGAVAALAFVGCERQQSREQAQGGSGPSEQVEQAQQQSAEALEKARSAQKEAQSEQQDVEQAQQDAMAARQELQKTEQELQKERQEAQQAQQQAQQEGQQAQQTAQQSQEQAAQAQQQAQQQAEQERQQWQQQQEAQAQQQPPQQQPTDDQSAIGGAGAAGAQQQVSGTVQSVQANALQVNVPNQGQVTLNVDPSTPVMVDGQQASFEQIEPGHEIRASYSMEGQNRKVTRIEASTSTGGAGESYPSGQPATEPPPTTY